MEDNEVNYTIAGFQYLLECEMATYEHLKMNKRSSKNEIKRHESIITKTFYNHRGVFAKLTNSGSKPAGYNACPRVDDILNQASKTSLKEALEEYFKQK